MKLVAGSYERFLWGWRVEKKKSQLQPIFSYPAHLGPIKCVATWGPVLATGGSDDTIKIFDTNAQKDMGTLVQHTGAVTTLAFYGSSLLPNNLLSGSEDGTVCIWDTDSYILYKTMNGHKKGVSSLSIHPSGRICLSVGRDSHLNMYDLLKGRRSFTSKLPSEASIVVFSPQEGSTYSLCSDNVVSIHSSQDGRALHKLTHEKPVLCLAQQQENILYTGGEDRIISAWDTRTAKLAFSVENAHSNRIRGLAVWESGHTSPEGAPFYVASASSDGCVRVWDARMIGKSDKALMEAETKARLTCLVACSLRKKVILESEKTEDDTVAKSHDSTASLDGDKKTVVDDNISADRKKKIQNRTKRPANRSDGESKKTVSKKLKKMKARKLTQ